MADNVNKPRKRRRYGSFAWTDKKTGRLYARVRLTQADGTVKTFYRLATSVKHAEQLADEIKAEHECRGQAFIDGRSMTFAHLAEWYKREFVIAPVYVDGQKTEGMRTWESERAKIDRIVTELGELLIGEMDETDFRHFRRNRLKSVKIATANRDFETIRAMFRKAKKKKWIREIPDFEGFIEKSLEKRRTVTLTTKQESDLLREARKIRESSAPRLYALIISLRDSGARPNELYPVNDYSESKDKYDPLRWRDVFDENGRIRDLTRLVSFKGKMREERIAVITDRMKRALLELWTFLQQSKNVTPDHSASLENLVFPHTSFKKSWDLVRTAANVPGLRLRDLRRDWVTRLGRLGYSDKLAQRGAGHKKIQTSFEYTEFDEAAALQAKSLLDSDNRRVSR
ncbi:MAG: tyrosine-type recombinase/integrase [Pyrinomonadaceae bacterium]